MAKTAVKTLFICKGSVSVGLGHVMRCRTVAAATARRGDARVHVVFVGEARLGRMMLDGRVPFTTVTDDDAALAEVTRFSPDIVVFDMLAFDLAAFEAIKAQCMTVSISPIFNALARTDMVFSRAAYPSHALPNEASGTSEATGPIFRTGLRYVTIAEHCRKVPRGVYAANAAMRPLSVAISMGGSDAPNRTLQILEAIRKIESHLLIWVLLGEEYAHSYQGLVDCVSDDKRHEIILARTTESMWRILSGCCVAILAGGITTYEAAYSGIPSIVTLDDANKRYLVDDLAKAGACVYAGAPVADALDDIAATLRRLEENRSLLLVMHDRCAGLVDRDGAERIAEEIESMFRNTDGAMMPSTRHSGARPRRNPDLDNRDGRR